MAGHGWPDSGSAKSLSIHLARWLSGVCAQGELDEKEFRLAVRKEGKLKPNEWPDAKLRRLFRAVDADGNGTITVSEFVDWMGPAPTEVRDRASLHADDVSQLTERAEHSEVGVRSAQDKATRKRSEKATAKSREPATEQLADDIVKLKMNFRAAACAIFTPLVRPTASAAADGVFLPDHDGEQDLATLFKWYDRDNSGQIGVEEFRQAARKQGKITETRVSDAQLAALYSKADVDGSGEIGIEEFVEFLLAE